MDMIKFFLKLYIIYIIIRCPLQAKDNSVEDENLPLSGIALNDNQFFRFNNTIQISFNASLKKGYDQYLEYLIHVTDLNKHTIDIILSTQSEKESEIIIISENNLAKKNLKIGKQNFQNKMIPFDMDFNLKADQLTLKVGDTVFVENQLGLKPRSDYRIILGVVSNKADRNKFSTLQIKNINTDPDLLEKTKSKNEGNYTLYWVVVIIILDGLIFGYFIWKKWKRKQQKVLEYSDSEDTNEEEDLVYELEKNTNSNKKEKDFSSIYLFKEFQVFDKEGEEISKKFTPLLKELFLLIVLYSQKETNGISTTMLKDILWYDKGIQSANNNRAVNIGKLKNILDSVGKYEISTQNLYIKIKIGEDIFCDYIEVLHLLQEKVLNKDQIIEIVTKTKRGAFLPECNYEWLDYFKAEISEAVIDNLLGFAQLVDLKKEPKLIIQIADAIFNFDNLNEKALSLKCKALINLGKHSLANTTYMRFTKDYESLYLIPYKYTFFEISRK